RGERGYPYIIFIDNANDNTVEVYKDKNRKIVASQLCSEIMLPSSPSESFVCVLASMNLLHYEEWKNTDAVRVLTYFLDTVATDFLESLDRMHKTDRDAAVYMHRAYNFCKKHRALGLG